MTTADNNQAPDNNQPSDFDLSKHIEQAIEAIREGHRHRGGQPGNQNARKHGFYSKAILPEQQALLEEAAELKTLNSELALMRVKLASIVADPNASPELFVRVVRAIARMTEIQERHLLS